MANWTPQIEKNIRKALESALNDAAVAASFMMPNPSGGGPVPRISWPNLDFAEASVTALAPGQQSYLRFNFYPVEVQPMEMGGTPHFLRSGSVKADAFVRWGLGHDMVDDAIDIVKAAYPYNGQLARAGILVNIDTVSPGQAYRTPEGGWWYTPVDILWTVEQPA